jgi:hypothetical protein
MFPVFCLWFILLCRWSEVLRVGQSQRGQMEEVVVSSAMLTWPVFSRGWQEIPAPQSIPLTGVMKIRLCCRLFSIKYCYDMLSGSREIIMASHKRYPGDGHSRSYLYLKTPGNLGTQNVCLVLFNLLFCEHCWLWSPFL